MNATLAYGLTLKRRTSFSYSFLGHKVTLLVFISASSAQYFMNHLHANYLYWCSSCLRGWTMHCYIRNPCEFCTGGRGGIYFSNISCFFLEQTLGLFFLVQIGENRIFLLSSFRKRYSHILPIQSMKDSCFIGTSTPYLLLKCIAKGLYDTDTNYGWIVITTRAILCIYFFLIWHWKQRSMSMIYFNLS